MGADLHFFLPKYPAYLYICGVTPLSNHVFNQNVITLYRNMLQNFRFVCPEDDVPILTTEIQKIKKDALEGNARVIYQGTSKCHKKAKMVHLFLNFW